MVTWRRSSWSGGCDKAEKDDDDASERNRGETSDDNMDNEYGLEEGEQCRPGSSTTAGVRHGVKRRGGARNGAKQNRKRLGLAEAGAGRVGIAEPLQNRVAADNQSDGSTLMRGTAGKGCRCATNLGGIKKQLRGALR